MAGSDHIKSSFRRKSTTATASRRSHKPKPENHDPASSAVATSNRPADLDALRKARLDYLDTPPEDRPKRMKYVYDAPVTSKSRSAKDKDRQSTVSLARRKSEEPRKRRKRKESEHKDAQSEDGYVYTRPEEEKTSRRLPRSRDQLAPKATSKKSATTKATIRRDLPRRHTEAPQRRSSCPPAESSVVTAVSPNTRRRTIAVEEPPRSSLKQSATVVSLAKSTATSPVKRKDSRIFSNLLRPKPPTGERKTSCLTCASDDVPISKSARLPCKHRMCHICLRRIFKMSITDPAHMPPRCCTDDHIDLKHVDKLFDQNFKKNWNRKFLEYKTKNKIYCIGKGCGEWIKPSHIAIEHGRRIGKCKRCGTRVCAICNNKAHTSRDCPKDPATKQFIETAKQKGWQKCYSCSAMVELKEGCNHMTCRCTAEFCMVCGLRWKSCDCPWFNYENVDAHLGNPVRYQEEMDRRRDQEERDEALARRMQALGVHGNAAGYQMNHNFIQQAREALTANYQNAEQAARGLLNGWVTGNRPGFPPELQELLGAGAAGDDHQPTEGRRDRDAAARERDRETGIDRDREAEREHRAAARDREAERDPADIRPQRRGTNRRRTAIVDMFAGGGQSQTADEAEQERRIHAWANGVGVDT